MTLKAKTNEKGEGEEGQLLSTSVKLSAPCTKCPGPPGAKCTENGVYKAVLLPF